MDPIVLSVIVYVAMGVMILCHVPIGVAMAIAGFGGLWVMIGLAPAFSLFATIPTEALTDEGLASIPLFLLMGSFTAAAGLSADLYRMFSAYAGHLRGGLAMASVVGCGGFGAISSSSIATASAFMRIALPEMLARGYHPSLACGTIAAGGTLGILIPPSGLLILYGILTEQFSIALFVAAIVPGILTIIIYIITIAIVVRIRPDLSPPTERTSWAERWRITRESWGLIVLTLVVGGGIYGGVATVIEGAALGCMLALGFAIARGTLNWTSMRQILGETAATTGMIYIIIVGASILSTFTTLTRLPDMMAESIAALGLSPTLVVFLLIAMYIIVGSIFDEVAAMVITLPVVFPLVVGMGFDPVWWGVINIMVIQVGQIAPPIGIVVFVLHGMRPDISLKTMYAGVGPFFLADLVRIAIVVLFPIIALWLPTQMGIIR